MAQNMVQQKEVSFAQARSLERRLAEHLRKQEKSLQRTEDWARWEYGNRPFYSVWILTNSWTFSMERFGVQMYDDGEILMMPYHPEEEGADK